MRHFRKRSKSKNIVAVLVACSLLFLLSQLVLALDRLFLKEIDTSALRLLNEDKSILYVVPLTAGATESCPASTDTFVNLLENDEIVVLRTSILNRCAGVRKMICRGILCSFRTEKINARNLLQEAINLEYKGQYQAVSELAADFPGYYPEVRRWPDIRHSSFPPRYSVRLPDRLMIFDMTGTYLTTRHCGAAEGLCKNVARKSEPW